jgi:uncharacterized protein (TIGR02117 family)
LVLRREDVPADVWPERDDFPGAEYLEVGWGDRAFYQAPRGTLWLGLKAVFWATDSVLHVAAFDVPPTVYFAGREVAEVELSPRGFRALVAFIADAHARTGEGRAIGLGPGKYGPSRFYLGREPYMLTTCNVWTARALRAGGFPITPFWALTAANIMVQVEAGRASPRPRPRWPRTVAEARRLQARLRHRLRLTGGPRAPGLVAAWPATWACCSTSRASAAPNRCWSATTGSPGARVGPGPRSTSTATTSGPRSGRGLE